MVQLFNISSAAPDCSANPNLPVTGKLEEKFPLMAAVSQMPDHARQIMAMRSCHSLLALLGWKESKPKQALQRQK